MRQETGDRRHETGGLRQEARDRRREKGDRISEKGDIGDSDVRRDGSLALALLILRLNLSIFKNANR